LIFVTHYVTCLDATRLHFRACLLTSAHGFCKQRRFYYAPDDEANAAARGVAGYHQRPAGREAIFWNQPGERLRGRRSWRNSDDQDRSAAEGASGSGQAPLSRSLKKTEAGGQLEAAPPAKEDAEQCQNIIWIRLRASGIAAAIRAAVGN